MDGLKTTGWWLVLTSAVAMWLGWGIRGQIGHANGAMIPGAFVALAISSLLRDKKFSPGLAVGLTAVGFGFGADETTMETAGMLEGTNPHHLVNLKLALSGLALKGALWALFGGLGLGLALAAYLYHKRDIYIGALLLVAAFYAGVWAINKPKLLYFSVTRREIWGGLLLGGLALLIWLTVRGHTRIPLVMAGCAAAGGAIGYPIAVSLSAMGLHSTIGGVDWWKVAETTFGAFMGAGIGIGTCLVKNQLPAKEEAQPEESAPHPPAWLLGLGGLLVAVVASLLYQHVLPWIILGALLWCAAFCDKVIAWHVGVTMTIFATAANVIDFWHREQHIGNAVVLWTLAGLATVVVAWKVAGWSQETNRRVGHRAFLFLLWAIFALSCLKTFVNSSTVSPAPDAIAAAGGHWPYVSHVWAGSLLVQAGFTVATIALTWMA